MAQAKSHVADEGLHVVVNGSALLHRRHNAGEVIVRQDHVRGFLQGAPGDVGAASPKRAKI